MSAITTLYQGKRVARIASWRVSVICSLVLLLLLGVMWYRLYKHYQPEAEQLTSQGVVDKYWQDWLDNLSQGAALAKSSKGAMPTKLPTGVFIQSFRFVDSTTVNLTGYIWHRYTKDTPDSIKNKTVLFPEAIGEVTFTPIYTESVGLDSGQRLGLRCDGPAAVRLLELPARSPGALAADAAALL